MCSEGPKYTVDRRSETAVLKQMTDIEEAYLEVAGEGLYMTSEFVITPWVGSGPILEVLQYQANPWQRRSKLLTLRRVPKISLISLIPGGDRIRY